MNASVYNNSSNNNVVHKSITKICDVDLQVTDEFTVTDPVFVLSRNDNYLTANYIYVPTLHRYYYATFKILDGGRMSCACHVDVLMSWWDGFKNSQCIAYRSTSKPDARIEDPKVFKKAKPTIIYRKIGNPFTLSSNNNYILTITGKGTGTA